MRVLSATPSDAADQLLGLLSEGPATILVGAFVSSRQPSGLPMAIPLKEAVVRSLWGGSGSSTKLAIPHLESVLARSRFLDVPLELIVEEAAAKLGLEPGRILGWMARAKPNGNHQVLAVISDEQMGRVVTTNFDELIECEACFPSRVQKLHGTISDPDSMIATLRRVGRGLTTPAFRRDLRDIFEGRSLCLIGHAGRDPDIFPVLAELQLHDVLWITRPARNDQDLRQVQDELDKAYSLDRNARSTRALAVDADALFDELRGRLNLPPIRRGEAFLFDESCLDVLKIGGQERVGIAFGRVLGVIGKWDDAARVYDGLAIGADELSIRQAATLYSAEAKYWSGEYLTAAKLARRAVKYSSSAGDFLGVARAYQLLGLVAGRSTDSFERAWASRYMRMVSSLLVHPNTDAERALAVNNFLNLGVWYKNRGRYEESLVSLRHGMRVARQIGDFPSQEKLHLAIALVYRRIRQAANDESIAKSAGRTARRHLKIARTLAQYLGSTSEELRVLVAQASLELDRLGRDHSAARRASLVLDQAELLARESPDLSQEAHVREARGVLLAFGGAHHLAIDAFTKALYLSRTSASRASILVARGRAHLALEGFIDARIDAAEAVSLLPPGPERNAAVDLAKSIPIGWAELSVVD